MFFKLIVPIALALTVTPALAAVRANTSASASAAESRTPQTVEKMTIAELEARMAKGDLKAQAELGARYGRGAGVEANVTKAIELLKDAAAKGEADAIHWLGTAYTNGVGVEKSETEARSMYEQAARKGHKESQYILGVMISTGQAGFTPDWKPAIPYFKKSADQGFALAEFMMGYAYQLGFGVKANPETAAYWYRRNLGHGPNAKAEYNLAKMLGKNLIKAKPGDPAPLGDVTEEEVRAIIGLGKQR